MALKHPEILYFLPVLLIPVLIHLFQLRRFKKEYFTNIRFLKEIIVQTRKSSTLKKWLLLTVRLLLLICLLIAFAQPFFPEALFGKPKPETIVLLDNSFSMQAKGSQGELLKRAVEDILQQATGKVSVVTCTERFWDSDIKTIQTDLQQLPYTAIPFNINQLLTEVELKKPQVPKNILVITDALGEQTPIDLKSDNQYFINQVSGQKNGNVAIRLVTLTRTSEQFYDIEVEVFNYGSTCSCPVSIVETTKPMAQTMAQIPSGKSTLKFTLPKRLFSGYVKISDKSLEYDNTYFFTLNSPEKVKVFAIGTPQNNEFLTRIFTPDEFILTLNTPNQISYNLLEKQQVIVCNELDKLSESLGKTLNDLYKKGVSIICIPAISENVLELNTFVKNFGDIRFSGLGNSEKSITQIVYKHPLYKNVFEKETRHFQYPYAQKQYLYSSSSGLSALKYADNTSFLNTYSNGMGHFYLFSSALSLSNSNFKNSPLIVPTFYNIGLSVNSSQTLAYTIGESNSINIAESLPKDSVLQLVSGNYVVIPQQQNFEGILKVSFSEYPEKAGNYILKNQSTPLQNLSFNYPLTESNTSETKAYTSFKSVNINSFFSTLHTEQSDNGFWKIALGLALLFLLLELLIQKFIP